MIQRSDRDGIAILTLNHGKANALDVELCEELQKLMATIVASDIRAVVLTGTGTIFSAGVDLFRLLEEGEPYARRFFGAMVSMFTELFLRERGYCCESGCRHCPYGFRADRRSDVPDDEVSEE